jgi:branched-chain amino acid transport system ATP-binding protein
VNGTDATVAPVPAAPCLEIESLRLRFGGVQVIAALSLSLMPAQRMALIGPNGAGKSSVINAVCGVVRVAGGAIKLDGRDVTRWPVYRRIRAGLGRTFQNLEVFSTMSVQENLRVPLDAAMRAGLLSHSERARLRDRADLVLRELGLEPSRHRPVNELPYGIRKLVEVGRCLVREPRVVFLDEPAAGLDDSEKSEFVERLERLLDLSNPAVVLVEHDMMTVERMCPAAVVVLDAGEIVATGSFREVAQNPAVITAYLGSGRRGRGE